MLLSMRFLGEFDRRLIFKGLREFWKVILMIFDGVESDEMLDFSGFCRSGYRSDV